MSLDAWSEAGLIAAHQPTPPEIADLLAVVETDLRDAAIPELSPERKLGCCYGAILSAARGHPASVGLPRVEEHQEPSRLRDPVASLHRRARTPNRPPDRSHPEEAQHRGLRADRRSLR